MKSADKHFRCTICQRAFTRIDHLKRHHLRHSGQRPYSCVFCNEAFARCDNLRDHYTDCAKRGGRKIPETGQRGRRRHACQSCTSMKLRCDGQSPCGSCQKRKLECNNERSAQPTPTGPDEGSASTKSEMYEPPSDRGSIKFLLNAGTDSFTEHFRLPPRGDRARGLVYHNEHNQNNGLEEGEDGLFPYTMEETRQDYAPAFVGSDPSSLQFFQDNFLDFFNGPFGDGNKAMENPYTGGIAYQAAIPSDHNLSGAMRGEQSMLEPERPFATALIQSILARAWTVPLDPKAQEELSANLNFLFTTARIRKFTSLYFKYWHPNCPILHMPSFDPETVPLPLLASVVFMGAMYSSDQRETYVAKRVLDFAELFVFSSHVYSPEIEIGAVFCGNRSHEDESNDWMKFQNFQAGFLITVVQYWAGSRVSRSRAMENRFSEVIKIARRLGLQETRHLPQELIQEHLWIQTECRIRIINILSLLDCAFFFYQNHPCRLTHSELECELPCEESLWQSAHPFTEPNFCFSRDLTTLGAFQSLFEDPQDETNRTRLTVFDMFVLIHLLYAFINTHMTLSGPIIRQIKSETGSQTDGAGAVGRNMTASLIPDDAILGAIRTALAQWRDHWMALRSQLSGDEWASMGFYKNGYNFWLVSQLLITKKDAVDVVMKMEVNCEDKLEKLKVLLLDEKD